MSIGGIILNIHHRSECFIVWSITNIAWVAYNIWLGARVQAVMFFIYLILSMWGLYKWRVAKPEAREKTEDIIS